ncbi:MAG: hypothetical protein IT379_39450 [Deltaproteobacteria bacterium]|nr:hypothetical protein [Deltaproteobacteria bacterium]
MAVVTYADFVTKHPEFAKVEEFPQAAVEAALADAELWHSAELYSAAKLAYSVRLRAAHALAISSFGEKARMTTDVNGEPPTTSTYLAEWERLRKTIPAGPLVA